MLGEQAYGVQPRRKRSVKRVSEPVGSAELPQEQAFEIANPSTPSWPQRLFSFRSSNVD